MADHAPLLENAFRLSLCDGDIAVDAVEGDIPPFVRGTCYWNGPARFARNGTQYRHWLDGDGRVCALRVGSDSVRCTARFVRTAKLAAEEAADRPVFRTFGTACGDNKLRRGIATESPANVSVYSFFGALLAFGEQSLPLELDPVTLTTCGPYDFAGQLGEISPFSAHPRFDPRTGELFNFGVAFSPKQPRLHVYRFSPCGELLSRKLLPLPYPCTVHDFSLSRRHAVFHLSPYLLDVDGLMHRGRTTMESLSWEPGLGSQLLVVERETGRSIAVPAGNRYCLHHINAFEEGEMLTVDLLEFPRPIYDQYAGLPDLFREVPRGSPTRYRIDLEHATIVDRTELPYASAPDFPAVDAGDTCRPYRDFWALGISATGRPGRKFFDQLVHGDWANRARVEVYQAPPHCYFGGEPVFVADPGRDRAGVILCPVFDAARCVTSFGLFDAFAVPVGPVAVLRLGGAMHLGFHGTFVPQKAGPHR